MVSTNAEIRNKIKAEGLFLWQVADTMGIQDSNFSRMLRKELCERGFSAPVLPQYQHPVVLPDQIFQMGKQHPPVKAHGVFRERPEAVGWSESTVPLYKRQALLISSGYPVRSGSVAARYGETASKDEGGMDRVNRKVV